MSGLSDPKLTALSSIYVSALSLSLIGSFSVIVLSVAKRRDLNEQAKPLFQLALADFLASLVLFGSTIINFLSYETLHKSEVLCTCLLPLSLIFFWISFLLVILYALETAYTAQGWRERTEGRNRYQDRRCIFDVLYFIAWLVPIIGYVIYIKTISLSLVPYYPDKCVIPSTRFCHSCILFLHLHINNTSCSTVDDQHNSFIRGITFAIVLTVLICCTCVYWKLQKWYKRYEQVDSQRCVGKIWSSAQYMILVIVFCWTPALVLISLSFAYVESDTQYPLFVVQAISVSLQGFLNSIVYAWRRHNFRAAVLGERLPLLSYANKAFFEQSLGET